jgi:hypothetical protein
MSSINFNITKKKKYPQEIKIFSFSEGSGKIKATDR